jgi:hypothetical protein
MASIMTKSVGPKRDIIDWAESKTTDRGRSLTPVAAALAEAQEIERAPIRLLGLTCAVWHSPRRCQATRI